MIYKDICFVFSFPSLNSYMLTIPLAGEFIMNKYWSDSVIYFLNLLFFDDLQESLFSLVRDDDFDTFYLFEMLFPGYNNFLRLLI